MVPTMINIPYYIIYKKKWLIILYNQQNIVLSTYILWDSN